MPTSLLLINLFYIPHSKAKFTKNHPIYKMCTAYIELIKNSLDIYHLKLVAFKRSIAQVLICEYYALLVKFYLIFIYSYSYCRNICNFVHI